ncbi:MAG: cytochrome c-550 PedF [Oceanospirillaceae bacterium]|jgi:cytochrome c-550 PedF|uniref:cytochrome c-550 PedF n=1 Tax=Marinobacterium litorale TaxID=404770 RepID=UPI00041612D3|nr:cytochrome c-550 PedF [Marinobacterium litorale]MBS98465.1 cytochrome c-550 PedF [Oceanospirillaceae bacterium]
MAKHLSVPALALSALMTAGISSQALAHGDVTPQAVDVEGLTPLGEEWPDTNPYRKPSDDFEKAYEIGASAYNQNCARCHGLEAISGGIAPDLRLLTPDYDGDDWYKYRVINGAVRDGKVYMPKMAETLSQEALWAIKTYLDVRHEEME